MAGTLEFRFDAVRPYAGSHSFADVGAIVAQAVPAFYTDSQSLDDMVEETTGCVPGPFGAASGHVHRLRKED